MSYHKFTIISGYKAGYVAPTAPRCSVERHAQIEQNMKFWFCTVRRGHWAPEAAAQLARRSGVTGVVEIKHKTGDLSGKGRGGIDAAYTAHPDAGIARRPLTADERDETDYEEVNEILDEMDECRA